MSDGDSDEELFPIGDQVLGQQAAFIYNDPSLLGGGVLGAVVDSDLNKLKSLVASGKSLNINDNNGNTALHYAVSKNHLDIIKYILDQDGILIDNKNEFGETAVSVATLRGYYDAAKILIDKGADVNCQENDGTSPLHNSVSHPEVTQLLLSNGADVNPTDSVNNTPLHIAVEKQCIETIYVLLYYDADVNVLNECNYNPFMISLLNNNPQIQEILMDYVDDFNVRSIEWGTLYMALRFQSPFYKEIVNRGAEVGIEALRLCIEIPNIENFRFVWNNLKKLDIGPNGDFLLWILSLWNREVLSSYVDIILQNSNSSVLEVLLSDAFAFNFHYIIDEYVEYHDRITYDQVANATFLFLQHGMTLTTSVIVVVFRYFGQCELFKQLLYFDYVHEWPSRFLTPILMFDLETDVLSMYQKMLDDDEWMWNLEDLRIFLSYWTYRPILQIVKDSYRENINTSYSEDEVFTKIPSLLQLARDETRKYIIDKFKMKRTSQYYTYINDMDLSVVYKRILKYEKKLYNIPIDLFWYP